MRSIVGIGGKFEKRFIPLFIIMLSLCCGCFVCVSAGTQTGNGLPSRYDMRDDGLVTPVKLQYPWAACGTFAAVAAAESSILSAMGKTYDEYPLDLSELHTAWFKSIKVPSESGEKPKDENESEQENLKNNQGGILMGDEPGSTGCLYAMGAGPVEESVIPYHGKEANPEPYVVTKEPEKWIDNYKKTHALHISDDEEESAEEGQTGDISEEEETEGSVKEEPEEAAHSEAELQAMAEKELREKQEIVKSGYYLLWYSGDDWTLPEYDEKGNSLRMQPSQWMLKNDNQLPPLVVSRNPEDESGVRVPNETGMNAVKQEILSGHGVMVTYKAEVFSPVGSNTDLYTNYENWAVYSYGPEKTLPHRVCIVGWDDNYPAENFTHEVHVTDSEGNRSVDAQLTAKTTPPGNGAWLIKNSRGSETDAIPDGMRAPDGTTYPEHSSNYGIVNEEGLHTGYNWISYYDQFLDYPESMEFTIDADRDHSGILQYDFLIKDFRFNYEKQSEHPVHAANVFTADQDMELTAVSARTVHDNSRVRFRIVKLNENAKDPEDGEELEQFSKTFRYFGYHRTDLLTPIALKKGDRFSVITTTDYTDDDGKRISYYSVAYDFESPDKETIGQTYARPGESFVMESGEWQDWTKVEKPEEEDSEEYEESFPIDPTIKVYDNFCIKVFFRKQQ